jgi:hypothetical protein
MSAPDDFSLRNQLADFADIERSGHGLIVPD